MGFGHQYQKNTYHAYHHQQANDDGSHRLIEGTVFVDNPYNGGSCQIADDGKEAATMAAQGFTID